MKLPKPTMELIRELRTPQADVQLATPAPKPSGGPSERVWRAVKIPSRHREAVESGAIKPTAVSKRLDVLVNDRAVCMVFGPRGSGKTQEMACLAERWCFASGLPDGCDRGAVYVRLIDLDQEIKDTIYSGKGTWQQWRDRYRYCGLLLIDELNELTDKAAGEYGELRRQLTALIDLRYGDMRPTVLAMNAADAARAREIVGDSIASRVQEGNGAIEMPRVNYRKRDER